MVSWLKFSPVIWILNYPWVKIQNFLFSTYSCRKKMVDGDHLDDRWYRKFTHLRWLTGSRYQITFSIYMHRMRCETKCYSFTWQNYIDISKKSSLLSKYFTISSSPYLTAYIKGVFLSQIPSKFAPFFTKYFSDFNDFKRFLMIV